MYFGLDGCGIGWLGVVIYDDGSFAAEVFTDIGLFWHVFGRDTERVLIDIPIGLPDKSERDVEAAARRVLPGRASSVFSVPVRRVLDVYDYDEASALNKRLTGKKLSVQTWNILHKIKQVDDLLRYDERARQRFHEAHPEVIFWALTGAPMTYSKKTGPGFLERVEALRRYYPQTDAAVKAIWTDFEKVVAGDDVLDALALAVAARMERFRTLPESPQTDGQGLRMAMVYPEVEPAAHIHGLHHAQITIPAGQEVAGRAFYCDVLNLPEIEKPLSLRGRGGFWLGVGGHEVHVGVEDGVERTATKAHLAYEVSDVAYWWQRLEAHGIRALDSVPIPGYDRFEFRDPFGNRVEIIQRL